MRLQQLGKPSLCRTCQLHQDGKQDARDEAEVHVALQACRVMNKPFSFSSTDTSVSTSDGDALSPGEALLSAAAVRGFGVAEAASDRAGCDVVLLPTEENLTCILADARTGGSLTALCSQHDRGIH